VTAAAPSASCTAPAGTGTRGCGCCRSRDLQGEFTILFGHHENRSRTQVDPHHRL
jgi:hypothetical protein